MRGVLDIPPAEAEADDGAARRVCWRAEAADDLVGEAMLGAGRLEREILQCLHWDLHLKHAVSQIEKFKRLAGVVELLLTIAVKDADDECTCASAAQYAARDACCGSHILCLHQAPQSLQRHLGRPC
jgi:hypothetical protein